MKTEYHPGIRDKNSKEAEPGRDISLWLDGYDDLFSDFDPRPYSARNISDDFLQEVEKVTQENDFLIKELRLLLPEKLRNTETENIIVRRLHTQFIKSQRHFVKKKKAERRKNALFMFIGFILMFAASFVSSLKPDTIFMHALLVLFEPAGWFFVWLGLENVFNSSRKEKAEIDFYNKMVKSRIVFLNINDLTHSKK